MTPRIVLAAFFLMPFAVQAQPLPIEVGSYGGPELACPSMMAYWSNAMGSGLIIGDPTSPIYGDNCMISRTSGSGGTFAIAASCAQGHAPQRLRHIQLRILSPKAFVYRGKTYHRCGREH